MLPQRALRIAVGLGLLGVCGSLPARAQTAVPAESRLSGRSSDDEKAIRALDDAFVNDYDRGDSKALAARFTEDAEVVEATGERYRGRALIQRSFADTFAASKGVKLALQIDSIRLLSPDAAQEEGRSVATPAHGAPWARRYTVIYVKRDGQWLIASVREDPDPFVRPHDRLKDLEWMIGDWIDEGADSVVRVHCAWSEDGNFLLRSFTVQRRGRPVLHVTQRIGWDPVAEHIRSWEFDSAGGFGGGTWSREGDRWVVKHAGVRPEGTTASATNIMIRERHDLVRWVSTHRVLGAESLPSEESYVLIRVPPAPARPPAEGAPSPAPNPETTRSPR